MNRVLLVVGGVVIVAAAAVGGTDWYLQKQVTTQINTAIDLAKAAGSTITVDGIKTEHFGKGVTLSGVKIKQGKIDSSIASLVMTPHLGGSLGLTPTGQADSTLDTLTIGTGRGKIGIAHIAFENIDVNTLAAMTPAIAAIVNAKRLEDLQTADWTAFAQLKADHIHLDTITATADHVPALNGQGDATLSLSVDAIDLKNLVNGTLGAETVDGETFSLGTSKSTIAHMSTTGVDYSGLGAAIPALIKMMQIKSVDDLKGLDLSFFSKMKMDTFHADHMSTEADEPGVKVTETVDAVDAKGFANGVLASETMDGLSETISMDGSADGGAAGSGTFTLHHAVVENFSLPKNFDDIFAWARNAFGITNFSMEGMTVTSPELKAMAGGGAADINIGKIQLNNLQRNNGMILGGTFVLGGVSVPASLIDNDQAKQVLTDLGLKSVDVDASFHTESDAAGQHAALGPISVDAKGLAGVSATMSIEDLGPYPDLSKTLPTEEKMNELMAQLSKAKFKDLTVSVSDHGLIHKMVADQAKESGQSVADLAASAPLMSGGLAPTIGDTNATALGAAIGDVIGGKQNLKIHVTTKDPIPFETLSKLSTEPLPDGALTVDAKAE